MRVLRRFRRIWIYLSGNIMRKGVIGGTGQKARTPLQTLKEWIKKPNKEKGGERAA